MKKFLSFAVVLMIVFSWGCSTAYKKYSQRIAISATPKEIFDIDVELRFVSASSVEKREMRKNWQNRGCIFLQVIQGV